ncbi:MAG TPA: MFS transporter, partial [Bacillota bacterium]|nr:MFS transporter [Bacillota bacterium]
GRGKLIILGYLLYSAIYFGFGLTDSQATLILLFALYGIYSALTDGVQKALIADLIDSDKRGTGLGIYNCLVGITLLPASLIAGWLYDRYNYGAPFYYGSVLALLAAVLMLMFYRGRKM